jgi:sodium-independent sulfate anion transporter 11
MGKDSASHFVTEKMLGIDVNARYAHQPDGLARRARDTIDPADIYLEEEPTVAEWLRELVPTRAGALHYVTSLFPSASWIRRYNARWLLGDVVAGANKTAS